MQAAFVLLVTLTSIIFGSAFPHHNASTLIVGGVEATVGEFPFIIDIRRPSHSCGASLVNAEWVVTAAHCTQGSVDTFELVAGDHDINVEEGTEQRRRVERIVNHPSYRPGTLENDISLLKVSQPFDLNSRVQTVVLPLTGFAPPPSVTTAGWGRISDGGALSSKLLKVTVPYVNDAKCRTAYGASRIADSMICAGILGEGGKDACQGDSGGPLMCKTGNLNFLCGLVSWGTGCAQPDYPGVYTEVSYFTAWVSNVINSSETFEA